MGWIADLLQEIPSAARYKVELERMEAENASLKADNTRLAQEVETLRRTEQERRGREAQLPQDAERILVYISQNDRAVAPQVAGALHLSAGVVEMHLEDLMESEHINASYFTNGETEYYLEQPGRRYLHAKELL